VATIEFFYDCGSPWTYLAFHRIEALASAHDAALSWKPILVGGVFNQVNEDVYAMRASPNPLKLRYHAKDLQDWARLYGLEIRWPEVFPVNSVKAMRGAYLALDAGCLPAYSRACFESYWRDGQDISQDAVIEAVAARAGLEPAAFLEQIRLPEVKVRLRAATDELISRGGFGSPTIFVNRDDMFFGNDRLPLVEAALQRHV
jgi:2-hydroxychromene-2-carboxylate isomerase